MAEIAQIYLGNLGQDSNLAKLVSDEVCLEVYLQQSDRPKGRIHAHTNDDIAVGIVKSRDRLLQSGDVFKTESGKLLIARLKEQELLVMDLSALNPNVAPFQLIRLGHVLGNHHYGIAIQNSKVYVQINNEPRIIEQIIKDLNIPGLQVTYETQSSLANLTFTSHHHA